MTDNIYSNPSGYTDIPWQLSVNWFKDKILTEVALIEYKMANRKCPNCSWVIKTPDAGKCPGCWTSHGAVDTEFQTLSDYEIELIDADSDSLRGVPERDVVALHNFLVECLRSACVRDVNSGAKSTKVREGLQLTLEWDVHFRNLSKVEPRMLIWPALKHSLLGNPLAGEVFEWQNIGSEPPKVSSKSKLAGAAALGVLAGFLFG